MLGSQSEPRQAWSGSRDGITSRRLSLRLMLQSIWTLLLATAILPPVGLVLLWRRSGMLLKDRVLGSAIIAVWTVGYLSLFFGLTFQMDGSGTLPRPIFYKPDAHYARLERNRAEAAAPLPKVAEPVAGSEYWIDFRGPHRDGRYDQAPVSSTWPARGLPLVWRQPIGGGYASFVIARGRAFTIEQRRHKEVATAYDLATGRELWANGWEGEFQESLGGDGPRATPTWHDGRIYAVGAIGELRCLDGASGKRIWSRNILKDNHAENLQWGMENSPLIVDDKVIVLPGGPSGQSVAAYNKLTGEPVWKALDDKQAYTSPMLATLAGKRQILVVSASRAMGVTVDNGALLWEYPWKTEYEINSAQPIVIG